ncbi:MAG: site-specific DNA-methyltransferase [Spirochaetales bacterium]|nr:site-specific DNA-methyltransferase [Spirochaetales bacterium]
MESTHNIYIRDSRDLSVIEDRSIDLIVTSPPYPMIQMWDQLFSDMSQGIEDRLLNEDGDKAFELMHKELDKVWKELYRVTKEGSFVCINIGDATRTIGNRFQLYSNHSRIIHAMKQTGFDTLPVILWRKQTNAPNKFMGSGMLPAGAYVTLEHEYILIFRKGNKRIFSNESAKRKRMESSFFWEERNQWFSDTWDFKGISQTLNHKELRNRSAAYPFELAYRLINMYSLQGDTVLDPFSGTGTTAYACIASGRNSTGMEIDNNLAKIIFEDLDKIKYQANQRIVKRIQDHKDFIAEYKNRKGAAKYINSSHNFPVVTRQETRLVINEITDIVKLNELSARAIYRHSG